MDKKRRVKEKYVKVGDKILFQQKKLTTKTPWDPQPYEVLEVKGSKVKAQKGETIRERAKNNIKVLKPRPEGLRIKTKKIVKEVEEFDLDVHMEKIRVLTHPRQGPVQEGDQDREEETYDDITSEEEEVVQPRPVRVRREPQRYDPAQVGQQHPETSKKRNLSARSRKRAQSCARFKKKEEPLRTAMAIKEGWIMAEMDDENGDAGEGN